MCRFLSRNFVLVFSFFCVKSLRQTMPVDPSRVFRLLQSHIKADCREIGEHKEFLTTEVDSIWKSLVRVGL
ncbi:hypothetical protein L596_026386 [Steinernema carpocapsae]|uniref:Secreted protein n=1 Tax=Steinernema carpocapsae TaxID=34508 RepID=A0A4U5M160_STECR|nr:hypothetical protein L596_026386 [Steinernema carpocapsae]